ATEEPSGEWGGKRGRRRGRDQDGATSYVSTTTAGNGDLYALTDLPTSGAIESVTVTAVGWGAGNCDSQPFIIPRIYLSLKSGGTVNQSAAKPLDCTTASAPMPLRSTWRTNPATR